MRLLLIIFLFISSNIFAAEMSTEKMPKHDWSFKGVTGTFDRAAIQRGYKVYREVCAGCHSMKLLYYRDLIDVGFSEAQVKVIASEYTVLDGPNDDGERALRALCLGAIDGPAPKPSSATAVWSGRRGVVRAKF